MIEVIGKVKYKYTIDCAQCGSILKYSRDDAKVRDGGVSWNYYIICPVCKNEISKNLFQKSCRIVDFGKPQSIFERPL